MQEALAGKENRPEAAGSVTREAYAKVNLTLDILGRRPDGYHELRTVMQRIGLHDTLRIEKTADPVAVLQKTAEDGAASRALGYDLVPADEHNLAVRAAKALLSDAGCRRGVIIHLTKRIPAAAGLAGGSTDAAATLLGVNDLYGLGYTTERLCAIGAGLGADIPYCILGGTVLAEGVGERLTALPGLRGIPILLVKLPIDVSTPEAYRAYDGTPEAERVSRGDTDGLLRLLRSAATEDASQDGGSSPSPHIDGSSLAPYLGNALSAVVEGQHPQIAGVREAMLLRGAQAAQMSGSGPSVYGIYESRQAAKAAADAMREAYPAAYVAVTEMGS